MKQLLIPAFLLFSGIMYGQSKQNYIAYNKLIEVEGTDYTIATVENRGKVSENNEYLLFINTKSGESRQIDFPKGAYLNKIQQIRIDNLNVNRIVVEANTVNLDGNKSIDWNDPSQVIVISSDGTTKTQITDDKLFVSHWAINKQTGAIVITGHYDSNNNGKYDRTDVSEVLVYDLKQMKLVSKI